MIRMLFVLALSYGMLAGCSSEPKGEKWAESHSDLSARLQAGRSINDDDRRDDAMVKIAGDATRQYDVAVALEAIQSIGDIKKRDEQARKSAIACYVRKDRRSCQRFVELISDEKTRDDLNARFAQ